MGSNPTLDAIIVIFMDWKESFIRGKELILATCSNSTNPNANIVISLGFHGEKLMIADCQMNSTIKNLKTNPNVCIIGGYKRLYGKAKLFTSGEYFDKVVKIVYEQDKILKVKTAIFVDIERVIDLDNQKILFKK